MPHYFQSYCCDVGYFGPSENFCVYSPLGYLERLTGAIMDSGDWHHMEGTQKNTFLQKLTKPVTSLVVQVRGKNSISVSLTVGEIPFTNS